MTHSLGGARRPRNVSICRSLAERTLSLRLQRHMTANPKCPLFADALILSHFWVLFFSLPRQKRRKIPLILVKLLSAAQQINCDRLRRTPERLISLESLETVGSTEKHYTARHASATGRAAR